MFSLHIDTARSWRGGQNQVLLTVNGLRAIGQRAALVAHPGGELRQRASEGLELIPIAPRSEADFTAAWRLSRVIRRINPDVIHAHDPHAVAMAGLALSLGASVGWLGGVGIVPAWAGALRLVVYAALLGNLVGAATGILVLRTTDREFPFGPSLVFGWLVAVAAIESLIN